MILARATLPPFRKRPAGSPAHGSTAPAVPSAPATPTIVAPTNGGTALYTLLSWLSAGQAWADLYLGTAASPPLLVAGYVGTAYVPTLLPATTYYWKIVASNAGGSTTGAIWSFTTPAATKVLVLLAGVDITSRVRWPLCTIHDALHAAPNTADLTIDTAAPTEGEALKIGLSSLDDADLLFAGSVQDAGQEYVDHPDSALWPVTLVDYTYTLNKRRPFGVWVEISVTTIALEIAARYAPGFSVAGIEAGLPVTSIVFDGSADFMTCWGRLATAITGIGDVSYARVLKLGLTDDTDPPDPLDANHPPLNDPTSIRVSTDLSQVRTRVFGKGHSDTVPCDCAVGEPIVPLANAVMFTATGGQAIAGTTAGGAQSESLAYAGVQLGGSGSLVGPGVAPSVKPTAALRATGSVDLGAHAWAYTWKTAAGESLSSPLSVALTTRVYTPPAPCTAPTAYPLGPVATTHSTYNYYAGTSGLTVGASYTYRAVCLTTDQIGTSVLSVEGPAVVCLPSINDVTKPSVITVEFDWPGPTHPADGSLVGYIAVYRIENATGVTELVAFPQSVTPFVYLESFLLYDFGGGNAAAFGGSASQSFFSASLTGIALGPTGTTQRLVYRTAVGSTQLQLEQTIANNTATTATATIADSALGANVPTSDTSGLTQPTGQVNAGSTSLLTAGAGPFPPDGGWVLVGAQYIRYTNVSGNTLAGILATGVGAITTTIPYGSAVIAVPALTGVNANTGLRRALAKGSTVAIWVERNDLAAQTALGLLELDADGNPTDGIREYTIVNGSRGEASLIEECDADLAIFSRPIVSAVYDTRDVKSKSGKTVAITLGGFFDPAVFDPAFFDTGYAWPTVVGDFVIQRVDITFDGPVLYPRYRVTASSAAFTLMDVLRRVEITR